LSPLQIRPWDTPKERPKRTFPNKSTIFLTKTLVSPFYNRKNQRAGCWWLTPVILATQEVEIRRIMVRSQPGKQFLRLYLRKTRHKKGGRGCWRWLKV
jgi:hypothetical protein